MVVFWNVFVKYGLIFKKIVMGRMVVFFEDLSDVEVVFKGDGRFFVWFDDFFKF